MKSKPNSTLSMFLKYLVPSMLAMALLAIYTFTDTFVVGKELGELALGAMGICTPVLTLTYALGFLCGMGGGALYSIETGKKNTAQANKVFTASFFLLIAIGAIIIIFGNIFTAPFANFLGADENNISYVMPYLRCIVSFAPFFMFDIFIMCYLKNDGHPNITMAATVTGTLINIVLDCLFVFVFKWGMFGAAIATCIGSFCGTSVNFTYVLVKKLNLIPKIKNISFRLMPRILKSGFSVFILECSSAIVTFVFIMQATNFYGTIGASIYTVIMNWTLICFNMLMGIAQSVQPLVSVSYGEGNYKKVSTFRKYAMISALISGALFLIIGYSCTEPLIAVFAKDATDFVPLAASCFRYYLPAYFIMGIGVTIGIYFQAIEASVKSLIIMLLRGIALPVFGAFIIPLILHETGLWLAVPFAELVAAIVAVVLLIFDIKKNKKTAQDKNDVPEFDKDSPLIITISREFGSGGREIGRELAKKLNVPLYDKELPELTATTTGLSSEVIHEAEDKLICPFGVYQKDHYSPISKQIFLEQCKVIEELAAKGACVFVGRCADYVLRNKFRILSVFVHAPLSMRAKRIMEYDNCTEKQALRKIKESDKARAVYHDFFTGYKWGKSQNYDLSLNSILGIDACINMILNVIQEGNQDNGVSL